MVIGRGDLRSSVFNRFPCDQESNCVTEMVRAERGANVVLGVAY
jgi:hypothetical protein